MQGDVQLDRLHQPVGWTIVLEAVGAILLVALVFDAILDPIVGQLSDNFRSRWGRRHPFMLAAAFPFAISFFLLWNPPLAATLLVTYGVLVNVPFIAIQRFNRFRTLPLLERLERRGSVR